MPNNQATSVKGDVADCGLTTRTKFEEGFAQHYLPVSKGGNKSVDFAGD